MENSFWQKQFNTWEFNRPFMAPMILLTISILASIACGFGADNVSELYVAAVPAMTLLALTLALAPMKWLAVTAGISLIMDLLVMVAA